MGSYPGSDNEAPLYVVDGMFFDNIDFLNNNDIKSISVLKDASAAAIYGTRRKRSGADRNRRAANTTSPAQITYDGYYGVQVAQNVLKMANAEQFTTMGARIGIGSRYLVYKQRHAALRYSSRINPNVPDANTDWYDVILRNAAITNHSVDVSGGGSKGSLLRRHQLLYAEGILDMKNE